MTYHVVIPGTPIPQGSSRAFVRGGRAVVTSANPRLRSWRVDAAYAIQEEMWKRGAGRIDGPVRVTLLFRFARPASHFGKRGLLPSAPIHHTVRPDLDKVTRAILDAMTEAGAIRDDAQVAWLAAYKAWTGGPPGVDLEWEPLGGPGTAQDESETFDRPSTREPASAPVLGHPGASR